jgi:drug/metabolite transporter (DMT)-like permease
MKRHLSSGALLLTAIIWGSGFIATEYAIRSQLSAQAILAARFLMAGLAAGLLFFRKISRASRQEALHGLIAGVLLFLAFLFQTLGQAMTRVSSAAFLTASNVVMIPFLVWLLLRKRPAGKVFLLTALTLLGIGLLTLRPEEGLTLRPGDGLILLCAFFFAGHITYLGSVCREDDPAVLAFWQFLTAGCIGLAAMLLTGSTPPWEQWSAGLLPVLYLGLFSTCLCYLLQTSAQRHVPPARAGVLLSTEGLFGSLFSVALGLEPLRPAMALGGLIITLCVILMEWTPKKKT